LEFELVFELVLGICCNPRRGKGVDRKEKDGNTCVGLGKFDWGMQRLDCDRTGLTRWVSQGIDGEKVPGNTQCVDRTQGLDKRSIVCIRKAELAEMGGRSGLVQCTRD
jgi:hypothetical protein